QETLAKKGIQSVRLQVSHAFHSYMMDPILESFNAQVAGIARHAPTIPWVSNLTGDWITADQAQDPSYWTNHLRRTVRFADGIETVCRKPERILLEVGPGQTLRTLAQRQIDGRPVMTLTSLGKPGNGSSATSEHSNFLEAVGNLWTIGMVIDWSALYRGERLRRLPLPTYPFERRRFWVDPIKQAGEPDQSTELTKKPNISDWFYEPSWRRSTTIPRTDAAQGDTWLVFVGERDEGAGIVRQLESEGRPVVTVSAGERYERLTKSTYSIRPAVREDYHKLIQDLREQDLRPNRVMHCWNLQSIHGSLSLETFRHAQGRGFHSLLFLSQALGSRISMDQTDICVLTSGLHDVTGEETLRPEPASAAGVCRVIPQEYTNLTCRVVDLEAPKNEANLLSPSVIDRLLAENTVRKDEPVIAYRGTHRWVQTFQPVKLEHPKGQPSLLRTQGVYLITGGLGGVGLQLAEYLVRTVKARLVLIGRSKPTEGQTLQLKTLEELGGEILTIQADVASADQMRVALAQAFERFGSLHGVIHAAGIAGGGLIDLKTTEAVETEFAPKVVGAFVLDHVLRNVALDFICFCSSLNALTGGVGQSGYCAANATLDAMAHAFSKRGSRVISVNFDRWNQVGMAVQAEARLKALLIDTSEFDGMSASQAQDAFGRILHGWTSSQAIVSVRDCSSIVEQSAKTRLSQVVGMTVSGKDADKESIRGKADLMGDATIEEKITLVWKQILGVDHVGLHDDFFMLGGESLAALQILNRLQEVVGMEVSLKKFFEGPTVAGLSEQIRRQKEGGITTVPDIVPLPRKTRSQMSSIRSDDSGRS
ncbi:MAG TPA: SDR family NAD(P)-dependent oxidoreductase, partial [Nitrospira sp.]|nr:SDR family NAD(P)-dependent oxidoreductase [Nitrospira sp.]